MLTGFSDDYLIASALRLDVNAFVLKPIARTVFSEKPNKVLMGPILPQPVETYRKVETTDTFKEERQKEIARRKGAKNEGGRRAGIDRLADGPSPIQAL